jgi:hypothetical protein
VNFIVYREAEELEGSVDLKLIPGDDRPWFIRRGHHRLPYRTRIMARLERVADRPVAALLVAAGTGFATSGIIAFLRLVN